VIDSIQLHEVETVEFAIHVKHEDSDEMDRVGELEVAEQTRESLKQAAIIPHVPMSEASKRMSSFKLSEQKPSWAQKVMQRLESVLGIDIDGDGVADSNTDIPYFDPETHEVQLTVTTRCCMCHASKRYSDWPSVLLLVLVLVFDVSCIKTSFL